MSTDYGTSIDARQPLLVGRFITGDLVAAQDLLLRLTTPTGALDAINDPGPYDSIDLASFMGDSLDAQGLRALEATCQQVCNQSARCSSVTVAARYEARGLVVTVRALGARGPFLLVIPVADVSTATIEARS